MNFALGTGNDGQLAISGGLTMLVGGTVNIIPGTLSSGTYVLATYTGAIPP